MTLRAAVWTRWLGLGLVAFAVGFGCSVSRDAPPRGLVLVVIDTLRADHLGVYGYARPTSPRIDALARESILFRQALAPSPWTLPSLATLMTSLYPSLHGAHSPSDLGDLDWYFMPKRYRPFSALHASRTTLAEVLRDAGFATFGAVQGSYPTNVFGIGQGFEVYRENATPGVRFDVEDALAWLDENEPERFFLYLHVSEVHSPYTPIGMPRAAKRKLAKERMPYFRAAVAEERLRFLSLGFDADYHGPIDGSRQTLKRLSQPGTQMSSRDVERLIALYDRGIAYTDYWIGQLLDGLAERGLSSETLFVLTADHGEEFLEHGRLEHSYSYYEEMLHVPLVMRVPGETPRIVERPVGLLDVMPTVLDVLGVDTDLAVQGHSLRASWQGGEAEETAYVGEASFHRGDLALRTDGWKYIRKSAGSAGGAGRAKPREELYDLRSDPEERVNRCRAQPEVCAGYRAQLDRRLAELRAAARAQNLPEALPAAIDEDTLEELRALGYVDDE